MNKKGAQNNFGLKQYVSSAEIFGGVDLVAKDIRAKYSRFSLKCFASVKTSERFGFAVFLQIPIHVFIKE